MITKQIDDSEFVDLVSLFALYHKTLVTNYNKFQSTKVLLDLLVLEDSKVLGLFKEDKLCGFTIGNKLNNDTYHFTDMYVLPKYRFYVKKLLEASEASIAYRYKGWVSESHTKEGIRMFEHYGAKAIHIKYYKEL